MTRPRITTMHQPEHLPWLGFFDKMRRCDVFVLLDTVQFARRDFQNRNRILGPQGPVWLTVPVASKGRVEQAIEEVAIVNERDWRRKSWAALRHAYSQAPHFAEESAFFEELYRREWTRLVDLNLAVIRHLAGRFGISTRLVTASELGIRERGGTRVALACCRATGGGTYLSGPFGRDYLDEGAFREAGIAVQYHDFEHPTYPQRAGEFVPRLSAVDLLFHCGPGSRAVLEGAGTSRAPAAPGGAP